MHPLVARIHPSIRTAFFAWFVTRTLLWVASARAGRAVFVRPGEALAEGAPGWSALVFAAEKLDAAATVGGLGVGAVAVTVLAEAALFAALVGVYRFVRRDQLPATAERATWLWAACPAIIWTMPPTGWTFAIAGVAVGLGALASSRHVLGSAALMAAVAFKPEALLVWPGAALIAWKTHRPGKQHPISPWLTTLGPPAAFTAVIVSAMTLAGRFGVSLRTLQSGAEWRTSLAWRGLQAHTVELGLAAALLVCLWLAIAYLKRTEASWPIMALPCLAWPLFQEPSTAAAAAILFGLPFFGYLARASDDSGVERPLLAAFLGGLMTMCL